MALIDRVYKAAFKFLAHSSDWEPAGTYFNEDAGVGFVAVTKPDFLQITMVRYSFDEFPEEISKEQLNARHWRKLYEKAILHFFLTGAAHPVQQIIYNTLDFSLSELQPDSAAIRYLNLGV